MQNISIKQICCNFSKSEIISLATSGGKFQKFWWKNGLMHANAQCIQVAAWKWIVIMHRTLQLSYRSFCGRQTRYNSEQIHYSSNTLQPSMVASTDN